VSYKYYEWYSFTILKVTYFYATERTRFVLGVLRSIIKTYLLVTFWKQGLLKWSKHYTFFFGLKKIFSLVYQRTFLLRRNVDCLNHIMQTILLDFDVLKTYPGITFCKDNFNVCKDVRKIITFLNSDVNIIYVCFKVSYSLRKIIHILMVTFRALTIRYIFYKL